MGKNRPVPLPPADSPDPAARRAESAIVPGAGASNRKVSTSGPGAAGSTEEEKARASSLILPATTARGGSTTATGSLSLPVVATHNFEGSEGELSFAAGDVIEVVSKDSADWWVGRLRDKVGRFPTNHTRRCRTLAEASKATASAQVSQSAAASQMTTAALQATMAEKEATKAAEAARLKEEAAKAEAAKKGKRQKPIAATNSNELMLGLVPGGGGGGGGGSGGGAGGAGAGAGGKQPKPAGKTDSGSSHKVDDPEAQMKRKAEHRAKIVSEILSSEITYSNHLSILATEYKDTLEALAARASMKIIEKEDILAIFSNIGDLYKASLGVIDRLKKRKEDESLGKIFVDVAPSLEIYSEYVNNYETAMNSLARLKTHEKFMAFVTEVQSMPQCAGLDLFSLMITPVQRIPRYELLLREVIKCSPEGHPDLQNLNAAIAAVQGLAKMVNAAKASSENMREIINLQERFGDSLKEPLAIPGRVLIRNGKLDKDPSTGSGLSHRRHFFLFNDALIYAAVKKRDELEHKGTIKLATSSITLKDKSFEIVSMRGKFVISAEDAEQAASWYKDIQAAIQAILQGGFSG